MDYFNIAKKIINKIKSCGYDAYIIGGAVRDYLLSLPVNDIDITTNMPLELLKELFNINDNGSKYQSVTIIEGDFSFEITHFRKDIKYIDHRHPIIELANDLKTDVIRRDFTINAIAMDEYGKIIDYFNGQEDLKLKKIKTIGNPNDRFEEDSLRILRALYFSSKLSFEIDNDTIIAINNKKNLLAYLSTERIYTYFLKIVYSNSNIGVNYINEYDLFSFIPEYKKWLAIADKKLSKEELAILFYLKYDFFPPCQIDLNKKNCKDIKDFLNNKDSIYHLYKYRNVIFNNLCLLEKMSCDIIKIKEKIESLIIKNDNELAVSKKEISSFFEGKEKNNSIVKAITAILEGKIENDRESILSYLGLI